MQWNLSVSSVLCSSLDILGVGNIDNSCLPKLRHPCWEACYGTNWEFRVLVRGSLGWLGPGSLRRGLLYGSLRGPRCEVWFPSVLLSLWSRIRRQLRSPTVWLASSESLMPRVSWMREFNLNSGCSVQSIISGAALSSSLYLTTLFKGLKVVMASSSAFRFTLERQWRKSWKSLGLTASLATTGLAVALSGLHVRVPSCTSCSTLLSGQGSSVLYWSWTQSSTSQPCCPTLLRQLQPRASWARVYLWAPTLPSS